MKIPLLVFSIAAILSITSQGMPIPNGTIIPESITYSIGEPDNNNQFLQNLQLADFHDYDGQVILLMYHASW